MSVMTPVRTEGALACDYAGETAVSLLDSLTDAMTLARPGHDAASFAGDLKRLADGAAFVAQELEAILAGNYAAPAHKAPKKNVKSAAF
ncbi:MAG: hypothetical protein WA979_14825 [Pacificimonas sp.]